MKVLRSRIRSSKKRISRIPEFLTPFFCVISLSCIGILLLASAGFHSPHAWATKQLYTVIFGIILAIIISQIETRVIMRYSYHIYAFTVFLLLLVLIFGHKAMGAQRWLHIGPINIQPSEFAKVGLVLALARFYHKLHFFDSVKVQSIFIPLFMSLIPFALISKQPNLSTAGLFFLCFVCVSFASGINFKVFLAGFISGAIVMPLSWIFIHDYQKIRILTFLNPQADPFGAGYNVIQSKIAIGSGGVSGKGLFLGSQGQLNFLPEKHTDFIISLLAEECGFIGISIVLFLTILLIVNLYIKSLSFYNHFSRLVTAGFCCMIFFHTIINIMMISGLFPAAGLPYPFLSYGRSSLLALYILFGIVLSAVNHYDSDMKKM